MIHIGLIALLVSTTRKVTTKLEKIILSSGIILQITHPTIAITKISDSLIKKEITKPTKKEPIEQPKITEKPSITQAKEKTALESQAESFPETLETASENSAKALGANVMIGTVAITNYENILANWLERYRSYPRLALRKKITGEGLLYVKINQDGKVLDYDLQKSTNEPLLDEAIITILKKADPLPKIPLEFKTSQFEFSVPIDFKIN